MIVGLENDKKHLILIKADNNQCLLVTHDNVTVAYSFYSNHAHNSKISKYVLPLKSRLSDFEASEEN